MPGQVDANDLKVSRRIVVYPGREEFPLPHDTVAMPLQVAMARLAGCER